MKKSLSKTKPYTLTPKPLLKIGQASKLLGVHIDTLRRWERSGKLRPVKTTGGTRFYTLKSLKNIKPEAFEDYPASSQTTEELLKITQDQTIDDREWKIGVEDGRSKIEDLSSTIHPQNTIIHLPSSIVKQSFVTKFLFSTAVLSVLGSSAFLYLTFHKQPPQTTTYQQPPTTSSVLAVTASPSFLEINEDTQINGSLSVRDSINGAFFEATPSASTITIASGGTTLTVTDTTTLDQDVSTTSTPTFTSLTLSSTTNQLSSGGFKFTLPGATTTLVGTDTTQTLTNKSMSGSANTFTNIPNSALVNKKVTITAGTNLTGGGDVELGSSITISAKDSPSFSGVVLLSDGTAAAPGLAFSSDTDTGLYRIGANSIGLITAGSATSGITINGSGNVGIGTISPSTRLHVVGTGNITGNVTIGGTLGVTGATTLSSTLTVTGNTNIDSGTLFVDSSLNRVGIGTTTPGSTLGVQGNVGIGISYANSQAPSNGLAVEGNVGIGTTTTNYNLSVIGTGNFTGQLTLTDGSASSPAYSFTNDTDSGLWRVGSNLIALTTGGGAVSGLAINSSGNVGIGSTSPTAALHVVGTTNIGNNISALTGGINIGSAGTRFGIIYADEVNATTLVGTISGGNVTAATVTINSDNATADTEDANLAFERGTSTPNALLTWDSTNDEFDLNSTLHLTGTILGNVGINLDATTYDITTPSGEHLAIFPGLTGTAGNVGIGTTTPGAQFSVASNATIGWGGTTSIAGPSSGLAVSGNVGVGTTSPLQALHVVGQCVARGTRIRRRRKTEDGRLTDEWEDVPVEDIKPDDEILSLNDQTGAWEWHKVEKTMDMGIQQVYRLETEGGKWIETTANHPYLVRNSHLLALGGLFVEGNIGQKSNNHDQGESNNHLNVEISKINHLLTPFLNLIAASKQTIPSVVLKVNNPILTSSVVFENGTPIATISQPADKLTSNSANVAVTTGSSLPILTTLTNNQLAVKQAQWLKVHQLKVGMMIATADGWEKISKIYSKGRKQTYDLQIENTHNFVGNNIVAHNTYITGNTGIGTSAPTALAHVYNTGSGDSFRVDDAAADTSPFVVNLDGNVGVANSAPSYALDVIGSTRFSTSITQAAGQFLAADGSAALPAYSFSADTNSGLWRIGADQIALTTGGGGLNGLAITSSGNIGIGLTGVITGTSATSKLDILGGTLTAGYPFQATIYDNSSLAANIGGGIGFGYRYTATDFASGPYIQAVKTNTTSGDYGAGLALATRPNGGSPVERIRILEGGNVGIGTTSPGVTLAVVGNATVGYGAATSIAGPSSGLAVSGNVGIGITTANSALAVAGGAVIGAGFNATAPTNGLLVQGNVGIGFSTPTASLHILNTGTGLSLMVDDRANDPSPFVIDQVGNVGIGFSVPASQLHIANPSSSAIITLDSDSGTNYEIWQRTGSGCAGCLYITRNLSDTPDLLIDQSGNVGIITASPGSRLGVAGNVGIGISFAGSAIPTNGLAVQGNVGVGTTSPLQALHVVGQCVAGDTRLRRRRKSKARNSKLITGPWPNETDDEWEDVRIDQIQAGDEILTLDEATGEFIPSTVRGLMDMGVQKTYILITESGKSIRTTAEHPYLVRELRSAIAEGKLRLFEESNIGEKSGNQYQSKGNLCSNYSIMEINFHTPASFLSVNAINKNIIPSPMLAVNSQNLRLGLGLPKGAINAIPNQAADRFTSKSDNVIKNTGSGFINNTLPQQGEWIKVSQLKVGMEVATLDGWEKIMIIKEYSREQVWDIEVENTHNFVGNNIVAHNTYITGNVGVGFSTPDRTLQVALDANPAGTNASLIGTAGTTQLALTGSTASGLAKKLVLGIDTTDNFGVIQAGNTDGTNYTLSLNPAGGNVGIGATTTSGIFEIDVSGTPRLIFKQDGSINKTGLFVDRTLFVGDSSLEGGSGIGLDNRRSTVLIQRTWTASLVNAAALRLDDTITAGVDLGIWFLRSTPGGFVEASSGTHPLMTNLYLAAPSITDGGAVTTDAVTAYIEGPPSGITPTNPVLSLWVDAGNSKFDGGVFMAIESGNVGIGATLPQAKLVIQGNVGIGFTGANQSIPSGGLAVSGNVGIGTTTANFNLSVIGTGNFTGQLTAADGTASAPAYSFSADTNSGLYRFASDGIALITGGPSANLLSLNSSGNVGVGTTSPTRILELARDVNPAGTNASLLGADGTQFAISGSTFSKKLVLGIDTTDNYGVIQAGNTDGTNYDLALNPAGGNIGIGTTTPGALFTVGNGNLFQVNSSGLALGPAGSASAPTFSFTADTNTGIFSSAADTLDFAIGGANRHRFTNSGGIDPVITLIPSSSARIALLTITPGDFRSVIDSGQRWEVRMDGSGAAGTFIVARTAGAGLLTVTEAGVITHTPYARTISAESILNDFDSTTLTVDTTYTTQRFTNFDQPTLSINSGITVTNAATVYIAGAPLNSGAGTLTNPSALVVATGNVGIGTTGPVQQFQVNASGTSAFVVTSTGNVGIGFTSPDRLTQIAGDVNPAGTNASLINTAGTTQLSLTGGSATGLQKKLVLGLDTTDNYGVIQAGNTDGTNYTLALNPAGGNVGIGVTTANSALEVVGSGAFNDGTAALPALTFRSDTDSGLWRIGSNMIGLTTFGSGILQSGQTINGLSLDSTGNIGIGTTSSLATLQVNVSSRVGIGQIIKAAESYVTSNISNGNISYWKFDENTGTNVADSADSNAGTWNGTLGSQWTTGRIGSGGNFNGSNNYIQVGDKTNLDFGTSLTVSAWVYPTNAGDVNGIAVAGKIQNYGTGRNGYLLAYRSQKVAGMIADATGFCENIGAGTNLTLNAWNHLVLTYDGSNIRGYLNGILQWTTGCTRTATPSGFDFRIGQDNSTRFFTGRIDEVGAWNSVLSGTQITTLYNSGIGLQYPFQSGNLFQLRDSTGAPLSVFDGSGNLGIGTSFIGGRLIVSGGNVGIGFTSPTALTHLVQTAAADAFRIDDVANDTSPFVVNLDGNVGIANSAPSYALDVIGTTRFSTSITQAAGQFLAADGTASLPAYSFTADTDTGLWRNGTNLLALTTNGSGALQAGSTVNGLSVNSTGNVGIGTTSQDVALQVGGVNFGALYNKQASVGVLGNTSGLVIGESSLNYISLNWSNSAGSGYLTTNRGGAGAVNALTIFQLAGGAPSVGIGLGTATPNSTLDIRNTSTGTGLFIHASSSGGQFGILNNGNVGIGLTNPSALLQVNGNVGIGFTGASQLVYPSLGLAVQGNVGIGTTTANSALEVVGAGAFNVGTEALPALTFRGDTNTGIFSSEADSVNITTAGTSRFRIRTGEITFTLPQVGPGGSATAPTYSFDGDTNTGIYSASADNMRLATGGLDRVTVTSAGNVGIGTSGVAGATLQINGVVNIGNSTVAQGPEASQGSGHLSISHSSTPRLDFNFDGNLRSYVAHTVSTGGLIGQSLGNALLVVGSAGVQLGGINRGSIEFTLNNVGNIGIGTTGIGGKLVVMGGNVGIGVTTPAAQLHVIDTTQTSVPAGATIGLFGSTDGTTTGVSIRAKGTITGGLADIGEYMKVEGEVSSYQQGDVLSASKIVPQAAAKSTIAYQHDLLGIVTETASFIAGGAEEGITFDETGRAKNRVVIALAGRVLIKVSSENGPIEVGDYLTSSSIPGVAMKATRPGQVVGKALEGYSGQGTGDSNSDPVTCSLKPETCPQGKILAFVNISYADPQNFFASLSFDNQGNLIVPKIRTGTILLDPSLATASAQLTADHNQLTLNTDPAYTSPGPNLASNSNTFYDLAGKIASLEERIADLEYKLQAVKYTPNPSPAEATSSATLAESTPSATLAEATDSATLASSPSPPSELDLTPPDILIASSSASLTTGDSAQLADLSFESDANILGLLTAYQAEIQDYLEVFGETILGNTLIAGDLTVDGTLSIESGNQINAIGTLFLQRSLLAQGLDIFNGKVTVDKDGTLKAVTIIADQIKINEGKSAGKGLIPAGQTEVVVENPYVEENSLIFITSHTPLLQTLAITDKTDKSNTTNKIYGTFKVKLSHPEPQDITFDYLIIGQQKISQTSTSPPI